MFLSTPEFTCRVNDVIKFVPRDGLDKSKYGYTVGTLVYINNGMEGKVDREMTSMPYKDVLRAIEHAMVSQ